MDFKKALITSFLFFTGCTTFGKQTNWRNGCEYSIHAWLEPVAYMQVVLKNGESYEALGEESGGEINQYVKDYCEALYDLSVQPL